MSDQIRVATIAEVATFFRWANEKCMQVKNGTPLLSAMLSPLRLHPTSKCFVAEMDGRIIGAVVFSTKDSEWELATVYVAKQYRHRGIALLLAQTGLRRLIDAGDTPIRSEAISRDGARLLNRLKEEFGEHLIIDDDGCYDSLPEQPDPPEPPK
ncbi:MAG TPA: GNAT family N-acetyltransferase [Pirellulales bacterium]